MLAFLRGPEAQRKRLLKKAPSGPLREYLAVPFPDSRTDVFSVPLLSVDFETTGLDSRKDRILSIGHVELAGGEVLLGSAVHTLIRPETLLNEDSVVIHRITDDAAAIGESLEASIAALLASLAGKVMLAHHAAIERGFLQQACRHLYGIAPVIPAIDTLTLARKWLARRNKEAGQGELRLYALREKYGLPRYKAHNALSDALVDSRIIAFPDNRDLVAARVEMTVQAIVGDIELATLEPANITLGEIPFLHLIPGLIPINEGLGLF